MPRLSDHASNTFTKMLLEGDSGSGKTGGLVSLVMADYQLRILDYDNGLESLKQQILHHCPNKLNSVEYVTLGDARKVVGNELKVVSPKAFSAGIKLLTHWKYDDVDLGTPADWGPNTVLVLDSLTFFADAAFDYWLSMQTGKFDKRAVFYSAQQSVEDLLALLTGPAMRTNVIVITHVKYVETEIGRRGYPSAVGSALSPIIPRYFNSVALCKTKPGGTKVIQTATTGEIDLKNPKPFEMAKELPLETGLATFFKTLQTQPKVSTLRKVK